MDIFIVVMYIYFVSQTSLCLQCSDQNHGLNRPIQLWGIFNCIIIGRILLSIVNIVEFCQHGFIKEF